MIPYFMSRIEALEGISALCTIGKIGKQSKRSRRDECVVSLFIYLFCPSGTNQSHLGRKTLEGLSPLNWLVGKSPQNIFLINDCCGKPQITMGGPGGLRKQAE